MKWTFVKVCLSLAVLLAAVSLMTPYPERLAHLLIKEVLRDQLSPPAISVIPSVSQEKAKPVEPEPDREERNEPQLAIPSRPWNPLKDFVNTAQIVLPPFPPVMPTRVDADDYEHITEIEAGFKLGSFVKFKEGSTASQDRKKQDSYMAKVSLDLLLPKAADGKSLLKANPHLPKLLANYDELMKSAKVSDWYHSIYNHKKTHMRKNAATLSRMLSKHNYYDTDTILEIEAPDSKRKFVWIQADMDVVSDGSDGDRLPDMPDRIKNSNFYQPSTSYRWKKKTDTPNPLLPHWESRLKKLRQDKASASSIDHAQRVIYDLKRYSFLLADYDPFIVLPLTLKEGSSSYEPAPGDYAVVIVGKKIYPAIVGDYGPRFKSGEASLRLCQEINPRATVYSRPVSDLGVSYLIFPHTKEEEAGPIDYDKLYKKCYQLLDEIGGLETGVKLEIMKDKL